MNTDKTQRTTFLVAVTVVVLFVLALLQYRWVDELSTFEREQRERALETSAEGLVRALDREFDDIQSAFRVPRSFGDAREDILEEYREWAESFVFPELVRDVFWIEAPDPARQTRDGFRLRRLNLDEERLESANWDSRLRSLGDRLAAFSDRSKRSRNRAAQRLTGTSFEDGSFAVVTAEDDRRFDGWVVVFLDQRILVEQLIPRLVEEQFGPEDQRDFDVWIINGADEADGSLLYASIADASPADRISPDIVRRLDDDDRPDWIIAAKHRAGSIEAFVDQYRRRNLSLSMGAVVVLGVSFVLLFVATRRAQSLAERQMEFVAGVSHELRTPIAGICSLSQNLADGVVDNIEQARRYGDSINREGRRLSGMVDGVLRFSALRSGRHRLESVPIDLDALVEDELEALRESSPGSSRLTSRIESDLPAVLGDAQALKSVLRNLVSNAIKFARAGGDIRVSVGRVNHGGREEIRLRVEDEGPGIGQADLPHIFEPFYRGRTARDAQVSGSGLGLSLVQEIVNAHGGRIRVKSSPASGTAFSVYLPVAGPENDRHE